MKGIRIARFAALAAAVALVVPGLAAAGNEVTKWNEIALNAIVGSPPAFPTPPAFLSAPPASAVFVAMVQGAVYGAVNAADRHGRPYLINRAFRKRRRAPPPRRARSTGCSRPFPGNKRRLTPPTPPPRPRTPA